jgi:hypothetical protein
MDEAGIWIFTPNCSAVIEESGDIDEQGLTLKAHANTRCKPEFREVFDNEYDVINAGVLPHTLSRMSHDDVSAALKYIPPIKDGYVNAANVIETAKEIAGYYFSTFGYMVDSRPIYLMSVLGAPLAIMAILSTLSSGRRVRIVMIYSDRTREQYEIKWIGNANTAYFMAMRVLSNLYCLSRISADMMSDDGDEE